MPLRATKDTFAYEIVGPNIAVRRKVMNGHWVPDTWFGDEAGTAPVDGAVEEAAVYGNSAPPASHRFQIPAGDVAPPVGLSGVEPSSLPVSTTPPFDVTYTGTFNPDAEYEASIVSADGQWTITPSPHTGEGSVTVTDSSVTATFPVAPDADNPGVGYAQLKDVAAGNFIGPVPFEWTAAAEDPEADTESRSSKPKSVTKTRRKAPDE